MGIRIVSKSSKLTLRDLSEFLYHLDNIYRGEVFIIQKKEIKPAYFYKMKLKDSESLFIAEISQKSPLGITIVPTFTYGDIAMTILAIIQIIIAIKMMRREHSRDNSKRERQERIRLIREEFEHRNVRHYNDEIVGETMKMTYSKIDIDIVHIENKTYEDYFDEPSPKD